MIYLRIKRIPFIKTGSPFFMFILVNNRIQNLPIDMTVNSRIALLVCSSLLLWSSITAYAQADPEPKDYYSFRDSLIRTIDKEDRIEPKARAVYNLVIASYEKENSLAVKYTGVLHQLTQKMDTKTAWADYYGARGRCI